MRTEDGMVVFFGLFVFFIVFLIIAGVYVLTSFIYKKLFEKDGRNGWYGFIPYYRDYILTEMSGLNWYWFVLILAPQILGIIGGMVPFIGPLISSGGAILSLLARVNLYYNLNKKFKNEDVFVVLIALLPLIGLGILAFSQKYVFDRNVEVKPDGFFGDLGIIKKENQTTAQQPEPTPAPVVEKNEEVKVTKEEVSEAKKDDFKEAEVNETPNGNKKNNNGNKKKNNNTKKDE